MYEEAKERETEGSGWYRARRGAAESGRTGGVMLSSFSIFATRSAIPCRLLEVELCAGELK